MILERGTLLNNRYRIVEILGQGGMGSVYRAVDENLGVEVAVKDNLFTTEEYARQFRREAIILANLRHPNLPRVTDHFVINGQGQYLVMDYIEGEDLRQRMERIGVLPEEEVITIGAAVCDALSYLATRKPSIIHRDIKPGNVKITPQGHIYLVDFGLAKTMQASQATTTGARAMTPGFSPPEQYGTARTDHRSDIFSLGATLYASLTGATPEDALARAMDQTELTSIRKYNPRISRKLTAAIEKALEVRPDDRYQMPEEFKMALLGSSTASRRRAEDYVVAPPPEEERRIPDDDLPPPVVDSKKSQVPAQMPSPPGMAVDRPSSAASLLPISTPLEEIEQLRPRTRSRRRKGAIGCWLPALIVALAVIGLGIGVYVYDPGLPSRAVAQIWPLIFSPMASPTPTMMAQVEPSLTPTTLAPTPTFTLSVVPTEVILPSQTFTPQPTATPTPTETPTPAPTPLGGAGKIAFVSDETNTPQIYIVNADGTGMHKVTDIEEGACQPSWSPDGKRLVFTSPCDRNQDFYVGSALFVINEDGSGLLPLPTIAGGDFDPAWSPDGNSIAFTSVRGGGRAQIYLLNLIDNSVKLLSEEYYYDAQPSWSKDGKQIIFISTRRGASQIWVMDADGKNQQVFTRNQGLINVRPSWSPDMKQVIFTQLVAQSGIPKILLSPYKLDSYVEYRLIQDIVPMRDGVFSPDGFWIAFEGWEAGVSHDIFVVTVSGSGRKLVASTPGTDFDPAWSPVP